MNEELDTLCYFPAPTAGFWERLYLRLTFQWCARHQLKQSVVLRFQGRRFEMCPRCVNAMKGWPF